MIISKRLQTIILLIGDLFLFYAALLLTLAIRYYLKIPIGEDERTFAQIWAIHKWPFFFVHIIWFFLFYISNLYDVKKFPAPKFVMSKVLRTMVIAGMLAALIFYLIPSNPSFRITPKTNLLIDIILVTLAVMVWRRYFWLWISKASKIKVLFFGESEEVESLANYLKENTQLGYEPAVILEKVDHNLAELIRQYKIQLIVASRNIMEDKNASQKFYEALSLGISTVDFATFYETTMEKIPVSSVNESWFLVNLVEINKQLFELAKRIFDVILAVILGILTLLILPLIAFLIKVESRGPIFYRQKRTGKNGKIFEIIKFRSMVQNAEENGAQWANEKDKRMTKIGKILRKARIDELPQLWNILKGEMSFIGPRPERPEFVAELQKQIPHYAMRHLIKPGLSGWAQIKFPYGASVQDATEKLQYDLYYVKNRSAILDLAITLRTIATMVGHTGR
ncbi:MAG: exopolysaccharide biosynthesis polyprenyl glycosylphosphotransferase [bacterium]|nr:exopolysaccharide biosynthesis polyprenyl glycosylphosphotransferase [bacterium]